MSVATVAPQVVETTPTPSLVTLSDGSQVPLPGDADLVPVGEGFYIGFSTALVEPQLFDFYAAWLSQRGWVLVAPIEAVVSQPHQRWRKDDLELLIELQPLDEQGRTVAWLQVSSLALASPTAVPSPMPTTVPLVPEGPWTNYTSGNEVLALAAGEGHIWAGTRGGAVRWNTTDGSYTKYTREDGLADNEVRAIALNQAGTAWFSTPAGVSRYDGSQWVTYSSLEEAVEADYAAVLTTVGGQGIWVVQPPDKVWLASGPVKVYDGQRWTTYTTADGLPEDDHRVTAVGPLRVWIGTWYQGLSVFDGQTWTTYDYLNTGYQGPASLTGLAGNTISAVAVDAAGTVWVGAKMDRMAQYGGLSRFDGREWTIYPDLLSVGTGPTQHPAIRSILPGGTGGAWLDTKHGLSYFDGANWTHFAQEQGLPSREVNALVMDAAGQLWVGTERGLARFDGASGKPSRTASWQAFLTDDGPASNEVRAVAVDKLGQVWFGTSKGLSVFDGDGPVLSGAEGPVLSRAEGWRTYTQADGLAADAISTLAVDDAGRVWAGTSWWEMGRYPEPYGAGVSVFDGTSWRTYTQADGLASDLITAITVDKAGQVWVGSEEAGLDGGPGISVFDGTGFRIYTTTDGLAYDSTSAISVDAAGSVWLGASSPFYGGGQGVSLFNGTSFWRYAVEDGLASNEVTAIAADGAGNVWVGTRESGISRWDGQTWTTFTAADGLSSNEVTAIAADGAGNVWVGTEESGLSVFTLQGTGDGAGVRTYTTQDGLVDDRVNAIAADVDGSLWLGTEGGVSHLRPSLLPLAPAPVATPQPSALPTATPQPPTETPRPVALPTTTPVPTTPLPPTPPGGAALPTGRYAQVWERLGGAGGPLGWGLDPAVEGFYAMQRFEHGLMHWGRQDRMGEPDYEIHIILYGPGDNRQAGREWYRYVDDWQEGDGEYLCPQAGPPWGPRRGFGKVWCECESCRDHLGVPVEEEWGEQGGYQDFQGGVMLWTPREGGIYVLLNQGNWRFEPVQ